MSRRRSIFASLSGIIALALISCACWFAPVAKTALDLASAACILANASVDDSDVAKACGIADALIPEMRKLLQAQRAHLHRMNAVSCYRDAGSSQADGSPSDAGDASDSQ